MDSSDYTFAQLPSYGWAFNQNAFNPFNINDKAQVAAITVTNVGSFDTVAVYDLAEAEWWPSFYVPEGYAGFSAAYVNNSGVVVGDIYAEGYSTGFIYKDQSFEILINKHAAGSEGDYDPDYPPVEVVWRIIGYTDASQNSRNGFITDLTDSTNSKYFNDFSPTALSGNYMVGSRWSTGTALLYEISKDIWTDLSYPGSFTTYVDNVNQFGQVVGNYVDNNGSHGFSYYRGEWITIPSSISLSGINGYGQIVGFSDSNYLVWTPSNKPAKQWLLEEVGRLQETNTGPNALTEYTLTTNAIAEMIRIRKFNNISSQDINLRDSEYWLRGYSGGLAIRNREGLTANWFNEIANRGSPYTTAVYNALKVITPETLIRIFQNDPQPGATPGGYLINVQGWLAGLTGKSLQEGIAELSDTPTAPPTLHDPLTPHIPLIYGVSLAGDFLSSLAVAAFSASVDASYSYFDPPSAKNYAFSVTGNKFTGIVVPTSVTTNPLTVRLDNGVTLNVTPGVELDLTAAEPGGATSLLLSGFSGTEIDPTFGFSFIAEGNAMVVEVPIDDPASFQLASALPGSDFDGNGCGDVLFRNAAGTTYLWSMNAGNVDSGATTSTQVGGEWQIRGVGDFDGNGTADLLWIYDDPTNAAAPLNGVSYVSMQMAEAAQSNSGVVQQLDSSWRIAGVGDLNGDGKADVLYRNATTGKVFIDIMNGVSIDWALSGFTSSHVTDDKWSIVAVDDFNHDGQDDILWRYNNPVDAADSLNGAMYEWSMNGRTVTSTGVLSQQAPVNWGVAGTGDFNGDGNADILFRYKNPSSASDPLNGMTYIGFMNGANMLDTSTPTQWQVDEAWKLGSIGDYNSDGFSDILWQHAATGNMFIWTMNGAAVKAGAATNTQPGLGWTVQNGVLG